MQIEKLIEVAEELKTTTLKLNEELELANSKAYKETGIYSYSIYQNGFHVTIETFLEIAGDDIFTIKERNNDYYKYQYEYTVDGILFYCISNHFWDFKKEENAEEDEPTTCMGCDKWEPDKNV